jgi:predicted DNA-binding transcriptional regulator YafY
VGNKRRDTLETTVLALELLRRIPRTRKVTAKDLKEQLAAAGIDRDLRTIQRQLEALSEHFEIDRDDANKPYGYRWLNKAAGMSMPMLSEHEALLLRLAEDHLRNLLPSVLMNSMAGFFAQARSSLGPQTTAKREREWLSKVRVVSTTQRLLPPQLKPGVFEQVSEALYGNRWLNVEYKNSGGVTALSEVMPLGLAQQGQRLYLVCRYRGYHNERSLAMHRLQSAKASMLTFTRPKEFDLRQYDDDGRFGFGDGRRIQLSFLISKDAGLHLLESPLSEDQEVGEEKGKYRITATVVDSAMLDKWLLGFGKQVTHVSKIPIPGPRNP